ncbi:MAG: hypothetical protein IID32_12515 [Planctomycetes bacterium]|nr:hypothetical protein [Planctomycetota bacterium]
MHKSHERAFDLKRALIKYEIELSSKGAKILSKTQLFHSPETWAPPALSRGLLYVSQNGSEAKLICYDLRQK